MEIKEIRKEIRELLFGIQIAKFAIEAETEDTAVGDAFIDVIIEELVKMKHKKLPDTRRKAMLSQPMGGKTDAEIQ